METECAGRPSTGIRKFKMERNMFVDGLISDEALEHIGMPRRSGRYPWGSGENPYHHGQSSPGGRRKARSENSKAKSDRRDAMQNRRTISDQELSKRIARLEQEKRLKELTTDDLYPGKREVDDAMKQIGKKALVVGGTAAAMLAVNAVVHKTLNRPVSVDQQVKLWDELIRPRKK